ncbi:hypothetical protein C7S20_08905 [Christiangramia fulva]|uniref:Nuclear transport factor 2 family protein n=1 Tax=Christiangramia fulva TaxID=2126553 RepID=A0A2R3Z565_9FLAO|nr:hypothetical protein [Christiangramia fulva]AVR45378.1 hypothetical protein C7S20_08905 [Christiangramia fulva]
MKKIMITAVLFLFGITAFAQKETNGTIYIKHPYIEVVNNAVKDYTSKDFKSLKKYYADSAMYWQSGMEKFAPMNDAIERWTNDENYLTDISLEAVGYPDYLHYEQGDVEYVQSWWNWSAKSKKTGEVFKVPMVMFDAFNKNGKIVRQFIYGDFSKAMAERM